MLMTQLPNVTPLQWTAILQQIGAEPIPPAPTPPVPVNKWNDAAAWSDSGVWKD